MAEQPSAAQLKQRTEELAAVLKGLQTSVELRRWCIDRAIEIIKTGFVGDGSTCGEIAEGILQFVTDPAREALHARERAGE